MSRGVHLPSDLASRAAGLSLVSNLGLMVLKLAVGVVTGSVAVLSDGIDSAEDFIASAIALASIRYGRTPPDLEHPYGHGRAETLAAMAQSALIAGGAVYIAWHGIGHVLLPPDHIGTGLGLAAEVLTGCVNLLVFQYVARAARATNSPAVASDARHLWTNVIQTAAIILGLGFVAVTGWIEVDGLIAIGLAAYLFYTAGRILLDSIADILDASLGEQDMAFVEETILSHRDEILGYHRLRTRRSGQHRYIELHLIQPPDMTVAQSHEVADKIEGEINVRWPTAVVTIHTEPADGRFRGPLEKEHSRGREGERP